MRFSPVTKPVLLLLAGLAAGCDDPPAEPESDAPTAAPAKATAAADAWLGVDDRRSPEQWLVERGAQQPVPADDPRVLALARRFAEANDHFQETPRMLANRTAQLTDVAREHGDEIPADLFLADLTFPSSDGSRLWFGVLTQAYIVLRQDGRTHAEAVATLRERYGS